MDLTSQPKPPTPTKPSDNLCKALAEKYPNDFLRWIFGRTADAPAILKTELQREPIRADAALLLAADDEIFHIEFQTSAHSRLPLPLRMLDYYVGLRRQFLTARIRQALVVLKDTGEPVAAGYQTPDVVCRYALIRMWEQDADDLLPHAGLLPLAPLCRADDGGPQLLRIIAEHIAALPDPLERRDQLDATQVFAGLRYRSNLVHEILRRTDMLEESVIYQEILQRGEARGLQQGLDRGRREGEAKIVLRLLARRFGPLTPQMQARVAQLSFALLEKLTDDLLDLQSKHQLAGWLRRHGA